MRISLLGPGIKNFTAALDEAEIKYELQKRTPQPGTITNATGDLLRFLEPVPWVVIATILVAWQKAKASRQIILTTRDKNVIETKGLGADEFIRIFMITEDLKIIDIQKPESNKIALMQLISFSTKVDGRLGTHLLPLIQQNGEYFVANPHADIPHQLALVRLDPKRIEKLPGNPDLGNYTGILLEIRTLPEELT